MRKKDGDLRRGKERMEKMIHKKKENGREREMRESNSKRETKIKTVREQAANHF